MITINTPITIQKLRLKNRLVMPPMATAKAKEGKMTQEICDYYEEKSAGGYLGLLIMEHMYINEEGRATKHQVSISRDSDVEGLKRVVAIVHNNNTPIFAQINHAGSQTISDTKLSASAIKHPRAKESSIIPKEMTIEDIKKVIEDFALAAKRVKEAGFDGVEIHSAHGYLLNQFYSPVTNKRQDQYGGHLVGRIQLHLEIIEAIRKVVGKDFPIALRLGACDYIEGGSTIVDAIEAAIAFEKTGVDILDISGGLIGYIIPGKEQAGYFKEETKALKEAVTLPVLLTGGVTTSHAVKMLLQDEYADLIGVGRAIFKDSKWAQNCMTELQKQ